MRIWTGTGSANARAGRKSAAEPAAYVLNLWGLAKIASLKLGMPVCAAILDVEVGSAPARRAVEFNGASTWHK